MSKINNIFISALFIFSIVTYPIPSIRLFNFPYFIILVFLLNLFFIFSFIMGKISINKIILFPVIIIIISIYQNFYRYNSFNELIFNQTIFLISFLIMTHFFYYNKRMINNLIVILLCSGVLLFIYGLYGYITGNIGTEAKTINWLINARYFGIHYTDSTRNSDVHYFAFPFIYLFNYFLYKDKDNFFKRFFSLILIIFFIMAIALSFSRAAWLSIFFAILFSIKLSFSKSIKIFLLFIIIIIIIIIALNFFGMYDYFLNRFSTIFLVFSDENLSESDLSRLELIKTSAEIFINNPFGIGVDQSRYEYAKYGIYNRFHSENNYLNVLTENGLFGAIFYYFLWIYPLIYLYKKRNNNYITNSIFSLNLYIAISYNFNVEVNNFYFYILHAFIWAYVFKLKREAE